MQEFLHNTVDKIILKYLKWNINDYSSKESNNYFNNVFQIFLNGYYN